MGRIYSLDYLRGLAATVVMIGHYYSWYYHPMGSDNFLQRLVTYSVCIFYILSGMTLYLVNERSFRLDAESFLSFAIKRVARIFPLLWLCIALTMFWAGWPHWKIILLNITGLFGFTKHASGIASASWSIGMEMVFYFTFPVFMLLLRYNRIVIFLLLLLLTVAIGYYYAFILINPRDEVGYVWKQFYIKPFNHLYLFAGGVFMGYLKKRYFHFNQTLVNIVILLCLAGFAIYPTESNLVEQLYRYNRVFFVTLSFALCWCFAVSNWQLPTSLHKALYFLGEKSYSIYLLHPIVFHFYSISYLSTPFKYGLSIASTLLLSHLVYNLIERPAMQYGKRLSGKLTTPRPLEIYTEYKNPPA